MIGDRWNSHDDGGSFLPGAGPDRDEGLGGGPGTAATTRAVEETQPVRLDPPVPAEPPGTAQLTPTALAELLCRFEVGGETLAAAVLRLMPAGDLALPFFKGMHGMYSDLAIAAAQSGSVVAPDGRRYEVNPDWPWMHRDPYP